MTEKEKKIHLQIKLTKEQKLVADDVKYLMRSSSWEECFMTLIINEGIRRSEPCPQ